MDNAFAANQSGKMTQEQRRFLLAWNVGYGSLNLTAAGVLAVGFGRYSPWLASVVALALAAVGLYQIVPATLDVLEGTPLLVAGSIAKSKDQVRGPIHYMVEIGGLRLRARKRQWEGLTEGDSYEIYYNRRSRWVLSAAANSVGQSAEYLAARDRQLAILERGWDWGSGGKATWTRDELHER
jgi:hypothetical protein